jgi:tripartite-type tricarboxylate transporter receptor subunit TctC
MRAAWLVLPAAAAMLAFGAPTVMADEPFYKGKRLTVIINFGPGPADIEGRLFARHIGKHIEGSPSVIVQNIDGAGGLTGTTYLGEIAPKDGTVMGHLTGMAWRWANDAERFRVDFKTYEFIASQRSTTVYYVRTDVAPGLRQATDIVKARGVISGGFGPDNAKDLQIRLGLELLGVAHQHVTGYRSSGNARLALQQGEINFYAESPPSYRSVVHPGIVKDGLAIPVWHNPEKEGAQLIASKQVAGLDIPPFHELYRSVKGVAPSGMLWDAFNTIWTISGSMLRVVALPPGAPPPAVVALQGAMVRLNEDKDYVDEALKVIGFVPEYTAGPGTNREVRKGLLIRPETKAFIADYAKKGGK